MSRIILLTKRISNWPNEAYVNNKFQQGLWLWHSWQRVCFRYQRTRVRIQSSATFIEQLLLTVCRKDLKINEKEAENGPFLKKPNFSIP